MISNLPAEIILMSLEYLPYDDVKRLACTNKRFFRIVKRNLPIALLPKLMFNVVEIIPTTCEVVINLSKLAKSILQENNRKAVNYF